MILFFFWLPVGLYALSWVLEFLRFWRKTPEKTPWSSGLLAVGWGAHSYQLGARLMAIGADLPAMLSGAAWLSIILYFLLSRRTQSLVLGFVFPPFSLALLMMAMVLDERGLISATAFGFDPALTFTLVLVAHILSFLAGTVLFALSCLSAIFFLYQDYRLKNKRMAVLAGRLPSLSTLEGLNERAATVGFFLFSVGIILGIEMAGLGTLQTRIFTPRDVVAFLTWVIYAAFLVERFLNGARGRLLAFWSIGGFALAMAGLGVEMVVLMSR